MKMKTLHIIFLIATSLPLIADTFYNDILTAKMQANARQAAMLQYLSKANPPLRISDLDQMSDADIRALFRKSFMAEGKGMLEAREMSEKVTIPPHR